MADPTNLAQVFAQAENDPFWAVRGKSIQAYASLEQSLCGLFSLLTGLPMSVAGVIFFKIVNVGTLYGILEKLLRKKYDTTYSLFWNSFLKIMRNNISEKRNQIVHWNAVHFLNDTRHELGLTPPNFWDYGPNTPAAITTAKMVEFIDTCAFFGRLCTMFNQIHSPEHAGQLDVGLVQTWRGIFLRQVVYPPPPGHPLAPKPPTPENPPPPSPT